MVNRLGIFVLLAVAFLLFSGQSSQMHRRQATMDVARTTTPFSAQWGRFPIDSATAVSYMGRGWFSATATTGLTVRPPTRAANDILVCIWFGRGNTDASIGSNWTTLSETNGTSTQRLGIYWRVATNSTDDSAAISSGSNGQIATILAFRGVNTTTPFDTYSTAFNNAADKGTPDIVQVQNMPQTTTDSCMIVYVIGSADDNTWGSQGYYVRTEIADSIQTSSTPDISIMAAVNGKTQAGGIRAISASQATLGFDQAIGIVLALKKD